MTLRLDSNQAVQRYDTIALSVDDLQAVSHGIGIRAPGRFTRSGVFDYDLPDGSKRREWRPPEEVFAPESYKTLHDVPITILHPEEGEVDESTFRRETVGHVSADVAPEAGEFLSGTCVIQDASAVRMAQSKSLKEFSAGYLSLPDPTPGIVPAGMPDAGKPYDVIQRRIRYNHVAFLPPGMGRAGSEVSIRLDSRGNQLGPLTPKEKPMTPEQQAALDALTALLPKLQALVAAPAPAVPQPAPTLDAPPPPAPPAPAPKPEGDPEKKTDSKDAPKGPTPEEQERMVNDSIELRDQARQVLGGDYSFKGKSNRDVMVAVVKHVDSAFELGQRSDDYLRGCYDRALSQAADREHLRLRTPSLRTDSADSEDYDDGDYLAKQIAS